MLIYGFSHQATQANIDSLGLCIVLKIKVGLT